MKPETILNLIEMLMERISDMEGKKAVAEWQNDCYKAEIDNLKKENEQLQVENNHLKAALVEKQNKIVAACVDCMKGAHDDDED